MFTCLLRQGHGVVEMLSECKNVDICMRSAFMEYIPSHVWIFNMFLASLTWNCWQSSRMLTLVCGVHIPCLHNLATTNHPCRPQRLNLCPLQQEIFVFWIFEKQITLSQSKPKDTKLLQKLYSLSHCPCPGTVLCRIFLSERMSRSIWNCRSLSLQAPTFYRPQFSKEEWWQKNRARLPKKESVLHLMYYQHHDLGKF